MELVPIKFIYQAVGPASFKPEAWYNMGEDMEASAEWVSTMIGTHVTAEMIKSGEDKMVPYASLKYLLNAFKENNINYG